MAWRFYFVPMIESHDGVMVSRRPKYVDAGSAGAGWNINGRWRSLDYGKESVCLLAADLSAAEHAQLAAQADVLAVPDLSGNVTGAATVRTRLEAVGLPADWVTNGMSWRVVLRRLRKIVMFAQRFNGLFKARLFEDGITLDSTVSDIPPAKRQRIATAADSLGLDRSGITGATTIRQALRMLADQLPGVQIGGEDV